MSTRDAFFSSWETQVKDLQVENNLLKQENKRLRRLLRGIIKAIKDERCMYPQTRSMVEKAQEELGE